MFYRTFKLIYLFIKKQIEKGNVERNKDIYIPEGINKTTNKYDDINSYNIYYKEDSDNIIIDIHGGAWICGNRDVNDAFCYNLADNGYIVSSLDYRFIDKYTILDQIIDIFNYLTKIYELYPNKNYILTGDSAGGQLALLCYVINNNPKLCELFNVKHIDIDIKCLILNHSVCYLDLAANLPKNPRLSKYMSIPSMLRMLYGKNYLDKESYQVSVNPTKYINKDTYLPPILLISSKGDVDYSYQTDMLYDYLTTLGKDVTLYFEDSEQAKHVYNVAYPYGLYGKKCQDYLFNYLNNILNKG